MREAFSGVDRSTPQGALLRTALAAVQEVVVSEGKKGRLVAVTDLNNVFVGVAIVTKSGVELRGGISGAIREGRHLMAVGSVDWD
ncbi:MAG: hypothetical protein ACYC2H_01235 [Thermoplasmatota archaeon]